MLSVLKTGHQRTTDNDNILILFFPFLLFFQLTLPWGSNTVKSLVCLLLCGF